MATLKYVGHVWTDKVGSKCKFEFKVDDEDLPEDPHERRRVIDEIAQEALWDSGVFDWSYEEAPLDGADDTEE